MISYRAVPELRGQKWKQSDGKQHAGEGDAAPQRQDRTQIFMTMVSPRVCFAVTIFRLMLSGRSFGSCRMAFKMAARWVLRFGRRYHRCLDNQGKQKGDEP